MLPWHAKQSCRLARVVVCRFWLPCLVQLPFGLAHRNPTDSHQAKSHSQWTKFIECDCDQLSKGRSNSASAVEMRGYRHSEKARKLLPGYDSILIAYRSWSMMFSFVLWSCVLKKYSSDWRVSNVFQSPTFTPKTWRGMRPEICTAQGGCWTWPPDLLSWQCVLGPEQLSAFVLFWLRSPSGFAACQDLKCDLRDEVNSEDVHRDLCGSTRQWIQRHGMNELHAFIRMDC